MMSEKITKSARLTRREADRLAMMADLFHGTETDVIRMALAEFWTENGGRAQEFAAAAAELREETPNVPG